MLNHLQGWVQRSLEVRDSRSDDHVTFWRDERIRVFGLLLTYLYILFSFYSDLSRDILSALWPVLVNCPNEARGNT